MSNNELFDSSKHVYNEALKRSGYNKEIKYIDKNDITTKKVKNRKRKVLCVSLPYDRAIKTNIGRSFINMINKHFGENIKRKKFLNKNSVKISYFCIIDIENIIKCHNSKILQANKDKNSSKKCSCRKKNTNVQ